MLPLNLAPSTIVWPTPVNISLKPGPTLPRPICLAPSSTCLVLTADLAVAQRRLSTITADVEREIKEAEAGRRNPAVLTYRAVQDWKQESAQRPADPDAEEALDLHLTTKRANQGGHTDDAEEDERRA